MEHSFHAHRELKILLAGLALVFAVSATVLSNWFTTAATVIGTSPEQAITLPPGTSTGVLGPGEQRWFMFFPNQSGNPIEDINLNAIFTAGSGASLRDVNFELFAAGEVTAWQQGSKPALTNFGAGMTVPASEAPGLSERVWRGALMSDSRYYLLLRNPSAGAVDYWLFDNAPAVIPPAAPAPAAQPAAQVSAAPAEPPPAAAAAGQSPLAAVPLSGETTGRLEAGQVIWFSFSVDNSPGEVFEPMALSLVATPNDRGQIDRVPLEIFTAGAVAAWSPDNPDNFNNVGAGSVVERDNDPWTGEKVWSGWIVSGDTYYVRLGNSHTAAIDYRLVAGDAARP